MSGSIYWLIISNFLSCSEIRNGSDWTTKGCPHDLDTTLTAGGPEQIIFLLWETFRTYGKISLFLICHQKIRKICCWSWVLIAGTPYILWVLKMHTLINFGLLITLTWKIRNNRQTQFRNNCTMWKLINKDLWDIFQREIFFFGENGNPLNCSIT